MGSKKQIKKSTWIVYSYEIQNFLRNDDELFTRLKLNVLQNECLRYQVSRCQTALKQASKNKPLASMDLSELRLMESKIWQRSEEFSAGFATFTHALHKRCFLLWLLAWYKSSGEDTTKIQLTVK